MAGVWCLELGIFFEELQVFSAFLFKNLFLVLLCRLAVLAVTQNEAFYRVLVFGKIRRAFLFFELMEN